MSRLIDAERFDVVADTLPEGMDMESYVAGQQSILNMIYDAPTVQETIRCEDCKYWWAEERQCMDEIGFARRWDANDYCSNGKRREP